MVIFQDSIVNELKMRLELLDKQNKQHANLMQEKLLFWLVGESIMDAQEEKELLQNFLERISELLDIPMCIAYQVNGIDLDAMEAFSLQEKKPTQNFIMKISQEFLSTVRGEPITILKNSSAFAEITFSEDFEVSPRLITLFPFKSTYIPFGLFVFIEEEKEKDSISTVKSMIKQLINMLVEKLEKIRLTEELKRLNNSFESQLEEKERKLKAKYLALEKLQKARDEVKESDKITVINKDKIDESSIDLIKNIGVEVRTPLNGIQGFAELIRENDLTLSEKNNYVDIIKSCGNSLLKIIDDAVGYSIIKSENVRVHEDKIDLTSFMSELYDQFKNDELFKQRKNLDLRLNINVNGIRQITTDADKLNLIFSNLIGNAIKFTSHGVIEIGCNILSSRKKNQIETHELLFYVKDTGVGIADEFKDKIYDEFFKVEHEISELYGGIGLGLSITKSLVEMLNGRIWFETEKDKGTQFYFTLPKSVLDADNSQLIKEREGFNLGYNWEDHKILIVEDDAMSFLFLKEILRPTKIQIIHAADGKSAIELVSSNFDIDLILMDIKLPGISGYEATKLIKNIIDIPVIAQTAYAMSDDPSKILDAGCDDYISKPINRKNLLGKMEFYLKKNSEV